MVKRFFTLFTWLAAIIVHLVQHSVFNKKYPGWKIAYFCFLICGHDVSN